MRLGLHVSSFTWPEGPARIGPNLAAIARTAEEAGFDRMSVMDHLFQIGLQGPPEHEMLEAYTTLGFLAGCTSRLRLLALVTAAVYRSPGLLAKMVTSLDVLSGGRAMLGIGAAWYEAEARGLGLSFPPLAERYEHLEETIQICLQMWRGEDAAFKGTHHELARTLNRPAPLTRPHPPVLIGGSGERRTLRLVARYAQACNLFPGPELARKLQVLRQHCEAEGRDYDEIEKTVLFRFDVGERGERVQETIDQLGELAAMGFSVAHGNVKDAVGLRQLEIIGAQVVPAVAPF